MAFGEILNKAGQGIDRVFNGKPLPRPDDSFYHERLNLERVAYDYLSQIGGFGEDLGGFNAIASLMQGRLSGSLRVDSNLSRYLSSLNQQNKQWATSVFVDQLSKLVSSEEQYRDVNAKASKFAKGLLIEAFGKSNDQRIEEVADRISLGIHMRSREERRRNPEMQGKSTRDLLSSLINESKGLSPSPHQPRRAA